MIFDISKSVANKKNIFFFYFLLFFIFCFSSFSIFYKVLISVRSQNFSLPLID